MASTLLTHIRALSTASEAQLPAHTTSACQLVGTHHLGLNDVKEAGALQPALALLQHKSLSVVGAGVWVLLEAAVQNPQQASFLACDPFCATLLASILSKFSQDVQGSDAAQRTTPVQKAASSADTQLGRRHTPSGRLQALLQLLWVATSNPDAPPQLAQLAPGTVPSLLGVLSQSSGRLLAPALGCLLNLAAGVPAVAAQLSRNSDLLYLLSTMTGRAEHTGNAAQGSFQGTAPAQPVDTEWDTEQECLAAANALGLLGSLLLGTVQAHQLQGLDGLVHRVMHSLVAGAPSSQLQAAGAHLREGAGLVLLRMMERTEDTDQLQRLMHTLMQHVSQLADDSARALLATNTFRACLSLPMRLVLSSVLPPDTWQQVCHEHAAAASSVRRGQPEQGQQTEWGRSWSALAATGMGEDLGSVDEVTVGTPGHSRMTAGPQSMASMSHAALGQLLATLVSSGTPPSPRPPAGVIQACVSAVHILRALVSSEDCAQALLHDKAGLVQLLHCLVSMPATSSTLGDDGSTVQVCLAAASTLAHLADYPCLRTTPSMQAALRPSTDVLQRFTALLSSSAASPQPTQETSDRAVYEHSCVTRYLAAVATFASVHEEDAVDIVQVLTQVRGALGAVIALIPDDVLPVNSTAGTNSSRPMSTLFPTATTTSFRGDGALQVSVPDNWILEYHQALAQIAVPRLDTDNPGAQVVPAGVLAALSLVRLACDKQPLAKVLATKTSVVSSCVNLMAGSSTGVTLWCHSGYTEARWRALLVQQGVSTLGRVVQALDEDTVTHEVASDPDLLPSLMSALQAASSITRGQTFQLIHSLLASKIFVKQLVAKSQAAELMHLAMAELGMLLHPHALGTSPLGKQGTHHLTPISAMTNTSTDTPGAESEHAAAAAAVLLHLTQQPPVPLLHMLLIPGALDKLVARLGCLVHEAMAAGPTMLLSTGSLMGSLMALLTHCMTAGVLPLLLPAGPGATLESLLVPGTLGDVAMTLVEMPDVLQLLCALLEWTWSVGTSDDADRPRPAIPGSPTPSLMRQRSPARMAIAKAADLARTGSNLKQGSRFPADTSDATPASPTWRVGADWQDSLNTSGSGRLRSMQQATSTVPERAQAVLRDLQLLSLRFLQPYILLLFSSPSAPCLDDIILRTPTDEPKQAGSQGARKDAPLQHKSVTAISGGAVQAAPPPPAAPIPGSPARPNVTSVHRRSVTPADPMQSPTGGSPAYNLDPKIGATAKTGTRPSQCLRQLAQVCCRLLVPQSPPLVMRAAAACLATVLTVSDLLAAYLLTSAPQCLDRLLGVMTCNIMDWACQYGQAQAEEVALLVAAAPATAATLLSSQTPTSTQGCATASLCTPPQALGSVTGQALLGVNSVLGASVQGGCKSLALGSLAMPGAANMADTTTSAPAPLQEQLCALAHGLLLAAYTVKCLAESPAGAARVVAHPMLAQAMDKLLQEDNVHQAHSLLELVHAQLAVRLRTQLPQHTSKTREDQSQLQSMAHDRTSDASMAYTASSVTSHSHSQNQASPDLPGMVTGMVVACGPAAAVQEVALVGPQGWLMASLSRMMLRTGPHAAEQAGAAVQATAALLPTPKAATVMVRKGPGGSSMAEGLLHLMKTAKPGLRMHATGVVAALVQNLRGALLTEIGGVEGLLAAIVDLADTCAETHARNVALKGSHNSSHAQAVNDGGWAHRSSRFAKASPGTSLEWSDAGPSLGSDPVYQTWLYSIAALAGLSWSGPVAARIATLRGVPNTILAALKAPGLQLPVFAAGLVGNLASHTASQALLVMTSGLAKEVCRLLQHAHEPSHQALLLGALRNLAATDKGRQELASEPTLIPLLVDLLCAGDSSLSSSKDTVEVSHFQVLAGSILANLSADKMGLEALVANTDSAGLLATAATLLAAPSTQPQDSAEPVEQANTSSVLGMLSEPSATHDHEDAGPVAKPSPGHLQCFMAVLLSNALSHSVLARTFLALDEAIVLRDTILSLPSPSIAALHKDPLTLLGGATQRMRAVACLTALRNLMAACGPRAVHWLAALAPLPAVGTGLPTTPSSAMASPGGTDNPTDRHLSRGDTPGKSGAAANQGLPLAVVRTPGITQLLAKVLDLLAWVDFYDLQSEATGPSGRGAGLDIAGAAAGLLGLLAAQGCAARFAAAERQAVLHLLRCAALSALEAGPVSSNTGIHTSDTVEEAASQAVTALWVLSSHPSCHVWAESIARETLLIHTLVLMCKRGSKASTRARFSTIRLLSAAALGQLLVQGLISNTACDRILDASAGMASALMDLVTLATSGPLGAGAKPASSAALDNVRQPKRKNAAPSAAEIQDAARTDALRSVGVLGDLQVILGMQAAGALAHAASHHAGASALMASPAMRAALPELLTSTSEDVVLLGVMILAGACSHSDPALLDVVSNNADLMAGLNHALASSNAHIVCYSASCMAALATHRPAQPALLVPDTLARLADLITVPLMQHTVLLTLPIGDSLQLPPLLGVAHSLPGEQGGLAPSRRHVIRSRLPSLNKGHEGEGPSEGPAALLQPQASVSTTPSTELLACCLTTACVAAGALENLSCEHKHCDALVDTQSPVLQAMCTLLHGSEGLHANILAAGGSVELLQAMESLLLLVMGVLTNLACVEQGQKSLLNSPVLLAAMLAALAAQSPAAHTLLATVSSGESDATPASPATPTTPARLSVPMLSENLHHGAGCGLTKQLTMRQRSVASPVQIAALAGLVNLMGAGDTTHQASHAHSTAGASASDSACASVTNTMSLEAVIETLQGEDLPSGGQALHSRGPTQLPASSVQPAFSEVVHGRQGLLGMLRSLPGARHLLSALATLSLGSRPTTEARAVQHMAGWLLHQMNQHGESAVA